MPDNNRWLRTRSVSGADYDATYERRAAAGEHVHGEADFVMHYSPGSVLDAGCGTGRVGRELARRGVDVTGLDIDDEMLDTARLKGPGIEWLTADLADVELRRTFDLVVMAGNVMIFVAPGSEGRVVSNMAAHLVDGGLLVAGFQLQHGRMSLAAYDEFCSDAGLRLVERFATWERAPFVAGRDYAVSVHRKPLGGEEGHSAG